MNSQRTGQASANGSARPAPLRVLCAEDDEHVALMLKYALEQDGHQVELVADGKEAFARITSDLGYFDMLVTDHEMPTLSGLELVEKLRGTKFAGKIIVHSSELRLRDAAAYRALAVNHIFTKPIQLSEFVTVVQRLGAISP